VAILEIKTADELIDQDLILRTFLERGGPIPVEGIVAAAVQNGPAEARCARR
jgi:hypothetical protein